MKKTLLSVWLALILMFSVLLLSGCWKNEDSKKQSNTIIGSWEHSGYIYKFNEDKTGSYTAYGSEMKFTYEDDGKKVKILYNGNTIPGTYEYRIDGNKLIINDSLGNDLEYTRK